MCVEFPNRNVISPKPQAAPQTGVIARAVGQLIGVIGVGQARQEQQSLNETIVRAFGHSLNASANRPLYKCILCSAVSSEEERADYCRL